MVRSAGGYTQTISKKRPNNLNAYTIKRAYEIKMIPELLKFRGSAGGSARKFLKNGQIISSFRK